MIKQNKYRKRGVTLFELVIGLTIVAVFAAVLTVFIHRAALIGKETALQNELKSLRHSLILYKSIKRGYPEDLRVFINTRYKPMGSDEVLFGEDFLKTVGRDPEGYPVDPFGNKYKYNRKKGVINSITKGYENW